jgi:hypothetical protein
MSKIIEKYFIEDEIEFLDLIKLNEKRFYLHQFSQNIEKSTSNIIKSKFISKKRI